MLLSSLGVSGMQGSKGVIPAHRSEEVKFAFRPSLAGTFAESLSVTNVLDERNTQVYIYIHSSSFTQWIMHYIEELPVCV